MARSILDSEAVEHQRGYVQALNLSSANDNLTLFLAAYLPQASTPVGRGENSGSTLEEFNIVRQFRALGTWNGRAAVFHVPLESFPADASQCAVLLQAKNQGLIAGSAAIALH